METSRRHGMHDFQERVEARDALIGVAGLGYVGLPVAVTFAEAGFNVVGVDVARDRVRTLEEGGSYLGDIPSERVSLLRRDGRLRATTSYRRLAEADAILICVPTPLKEGAPDLSSVTESGKAIGRILRDGTLVVLESTSYPGTTEELLCPLLEAGGLKAGADFFLAFSPERIDPANEFYGFGDIPKVVGGIDRESSKAAVLLYGQVVPKVVTVSGTREAELSKLIENTFRHANIALINELAIYAHEMGIDIWEALEAAASKPFGFMPFYPSPGWGGHCIPSDPAYLSWRVRQHRAHDIRFVELAHAINSEMPRHVVERTAMLLNDLGKPLSRAQILCIGAAYKGGTADVRESPGIKILDMLMQRGVKVSYHDPLVPAVDIGDSSLASVDLTAKTLQQADLVLILVPQVDVDWNLVKKESSLVFDCCNALGGKRRKVVRL